MTTRRAQAKPVDILVSGGGIAGLAAAAAFGSAGFDVLCVDPTPPVVDRDADGADLRSTAFLQPARDFLDEIGLWPALAESARPLQKMRIVDAGGPTGVPRVNHAFDADDISDRPFGWNLPNWLLRRAFSAHLDGLDRVTFCPGVATEALLGREREALVTLSDGSRWRARLVVAADGRSSPMREAAGINVRTWRFGQKALAFAVTHPIPHQDVSTEIHRSGGPFTLVPLPDREGRPSSAVVWMEEGPKADALMALDIPDFEAAMSDRSCHLFGPLELASRRTIWPIIAQEAERLDGERVALVAEAAHVVPPIGAQGLNMSLKDVASLRALALARPDGLGDRQMLKAYHEARIGDIRARVAGIAALNRISMLSQPVLRDLRAAGLDALWRAAPVRRGVMQLGLAARG